MFENSAPAKVQPSQVSHKTFISKFIILSFCGFALFGSAASCDFNLFGGGSKGEVRYGVLKSDPSVKDNGFAFVNTVKLYDDSLKQGALNDQKGIKIVPRGKDEMYLITEGKGLMFTNSGGREWSRVYVFPVDGKTIDEQNSQIAKNDTLKILDITFPIDGDNQSFYVTGSIGVNSKIYRTNDAGQTFVEIYDTVTSGNNVFVEQILADGRAQTSSVLLATLTGGDIVRTVDGGVSWQKLERPSNISGSNYPLQMGVLNRNGYRIFVVYENGGIIISDDGINFRELKVKTAQKNSNTSSSTSWWYNSASYLSPKKLVKSPSSDEIVIISNDKVYIGSSLEGEYKEVKLPIQPDRINVSDVAIDPKVGTARLILSINNQIFESNNKGETWTANDKIQQPGVTYGNIGQIHIDNDDTRKVYLMLIDPNYRRRGGSLSNFFGF